MNKEEMESNEASAVDAYFQVFLWWGECGVRLV